MSDIKSKIKEKLENDTLVYGILGVGYVGLPLAKAISSSGYNVKGIDINISRVEGLNAGTSPIKEIADAEIQKMLSGGFVATTDFSAVSECDVLILCLPTPLSLNREPDLTAVRATMASIQQYLKPGHVLSLESTTWPGTTDEVLKPYLVDVGLTIGEDVFLAYSPEREDPGNVKYHTNSIPKIISGWSQACCEVGKAVYSPFIDTLVPVSNTATAEMVKLVENIQRSVNIGLMNELKQVCDAMDIDIFEVIDAAATKPFGFTPYYPGPGVGGHCIPIDPFYLTWKAREFGLHTRFIELAGEINAQMPNHVVAKLYEALNKLGKPIKGSRILCAGISYKRDVDDVRESPSVVVMEAIRDAGGIVDYCDPYVPHFPKMRQHEFDLSSVEMTPENISAFDAVMLLTDHNCFDYEMIEKNASLIIDTRGKFRERPKNPKIASA